MKLATMPAILLVAPLLLTGCSKQTYTADYLLTDSAKRKEILADCKQNKQSTENCNSANQAQSAIAMKYQTKSMKYETLQLQQKTADDGKRMFGSSLKYEADTKARQEQMQQLKAEMEALSKQ